MHEELEAETEWETQVNKEANGSCRVYKHMMVWRQLFAE